MWCVKSAIYIYVPGVGVIEGDHWSADNERNLICNHVWCVGKFSMLRTQKVDVLCPWGSFMLKEAITMHALLWIICSVVIKLTKSTVGISYLVDRFSLATAWGNVEGIIHFISLWINAWVWGALTQLHECMHMPQSPTLHSHATCNFVHHANTCNASAITSNSVKVIKRAPCNHMYIYP